MQLLKRVTSQCCKPHQNAEKRAKQGVVKDKIPNFRQCRGGDLKSSGAECPTVEITKHGPYYVEYGRT